METAKWCLPLYMVLILCERLYCLTELLSYGTGMALVWLYPWYNLSQPDTRIDSWNICSVTEERVFVFYLLILFVVNDYTRLPKLRSSRYCFNMNIQCFTIYCQWSFRWHIHSLRHILWPFVVRSANRSLSCFYGNLLFLGRLELGKSCRCRHVKTDTEIGWPRFDFDPTHAMRGRLPPIFFLPVQVWLSSCVMLQERLLGYKAQLCCVH